MIPHNKPTLGKEEEEAALKVLRSGWLAQGHQVNAFEDEFCQFLNLPHGHAVAVSNGTAALFLALWVLNANDKKIAFPAYACSALRNSCALSGGIPILVDNEVASPNINIKLIDGIDADIAIVPHMFGVPVAVPEKHSIDIIEDCAQALGTIVGDAPVGTKGRVGIYSFFATKLITSGGQGGMVVSKERALIDEIKDYREFDCRRDRKQRFNFKMTDLQAAVGRVQLQKLPGFIIRRQEIFDYYKQAGLSMMDVAPNSKPSSVTVRFRAILKTNNPQSIIKILEESNIKSIVPIEEWELLGDSSLFPNATDLTKKTVSLPIYPSLTNREVDLIGSILKRREEI